MFLRTLSVENYKGYEGEQNINFSQNLCYFVGNNNTGKSTIFECIEFLKSGLPTAKALKDIQNKTTKGDVSVTATFRGDIKNVISDFSQSKYNKYVFEDNGEETLIARRASKVGKVKQAGKEVEINIKKITLWNDSEKQFENPAGIDTVFKTLFEAQFIWADTNPDDIADFGSTKICGRLLTAAVGNFFTTDQWGEFTKVHDQTFHSGKDSLRSRTKGLETRLQKIVNEQHGVASISFNFQLPDPSSFIKSGNINIDDGTDTSSKEKGSGMQRALALALIQLYAEELCKHPMDPLKRKPLFLFIDEPETFLHPSAQTKFLEALDIISAVQQVFVTTHSPYLLSTFNKANHALYVFSKTSAANSVKSSSALSLFGGSSPTWGEINYYAYDMISKEFHNELYGFVQAKAITVDPDNEREQQFDSYLNVQGLAKSKSWIREYGGVPQPAQPRTLPTYIRNFIHHPENSRNTVYTDTELRRSIESLIPLV
jgi:putative ATP-dependent endonuclease of OLD family